MLDTTEAGSPAWWLKRLDDARVARLPDLEKHERYYSGNHPLPFLPPKHEQEYKAEFLELLEQSRSNFMELVVDAELERLQVDGFRLSGQSDQKADEATWAIWQANQMDAEAPVGFTEALSKGIGYLSVWEGPEHPTIAVEDPLQTIVGYEPGSNYRRRQAALKVWTDDWTGHQRANVYLPDGIYKFDRPENAENWTEIDDDFVKNPLPGVVPIVPLRNRPRLRAEGRSEIANLITDQQRINSVLFYLMMAGFHTAWRQKAVSGLTVDEDPETGQIKKPFNPRMDEVLWTEDPQARWHEFGQTDLKGYIETIEQKVLHISVKSQTPRHYLIQQGQSPSGDAMDSAEAGLVRKCWRAQTSLGEGLEEALRLARRFAGETNDPVDSEIVWADARHRTESQITDAIIKQHAAGLITTAMAQEKLGYSTTQIERMSKDLVAESLARQGVSLTGLLSTEPGGTGPSGQPPAG